METIRLQALPHRTLPQRGQHRGEFTWRNTAALILSSLFGTKFLLAPSTGLSISRSVNPVEIISSAFAVGWLAIMECMFLFWQFKTHLKCLQLALGKKGKDHGVIPWGAAKSLEHVCIGISWSTCCQEDSRSPKRLSHFLPISGSICFS